MMNTWNYNFEDHLNRFQVASSEFYKIISGFKPTDDNELKEEIMLYISYWCEFIVDILNKYNKKLLSLEIPENAFWGHIYWKFLHEMTFVIEDDDILKNRFLNLFISFFVFLRCSICSYDFRKKNVYKNIIEPVLQKEKDLISAFYEFHNFVNITKKEPSQILRVDGFERLYECGRIPRRDSNPEKRNNNA